MLASQQKQYFLVNTKILNKYRKMQNKYVSALLKYSKTW